MGGLQVVEGELGINGMKILDKQLKNNEAQEVSS